MGFFMYASLMGCGVHIAPPTIKLDEKSNELDIWQGVKTNPQDIRNGAVHSTFSHQNFC